jgi:hypothetical protein
MPPCGAFVLFSASHVPNTFIERKPTDIMFNPFLLLANYNPLVSDMARRIEDIVGRIGEDQGLPKALKHNINAFWLTRPRRLVSSAKFDTFFLQARGPVLMATRPAVAHLFDTR